jgi:hypothetical protein
MMRTPDCGSPFCFLAAHGSRFFNLFRLRIDGRLLTARFEVQILGEELLILLRCALIQRIAFFIPFCPPVGYEPRTPGLRAPRLLKMGVSYQGKFDILNLYIIQIRMSCKYTY